MAKKATAPAKPATADQEKKPAEPAKPKRTRKPKATKPPAKEETKPEPQPCEALPLRVRKGAKFIAGEIVHRHGLDGDNVAMAAELAKAMGKDVDAQVAYDVRHAKNAIAGYLAAMDSLPAGVEVVQPKPRGK